jgi:hypothetical protein
MNAVVEVGKSLGAMEEEPNRMRVAPCGRAFSGNVLWRARSNDAL